MNKQIGFITPTKGRPELYQRLHQSYIKNRLILTGVAEVAGELEYARGYYSEEFSVIDFAENKAYGMNGRALYTPSSYELQQKLNYGAGMMFDAGFKYIGTFSDDVIIHTKDFDKTIVEFFENNPTKHIIYCNDLLVKDQLATHWVIRRGVYQAFGFMALPCLTHMFVDNFWTMIGKETDTIHYFKDIVWEHAHFVNKKAVLDDTYKQSNRPEIFKKDEEAFNNFIKSEEYSRLKTLITDHDKITGASQN